MHFAIESQYRDFQFGISSIKDDSTPSQASEEVGAGNNSDVVGAVLALTCQFVWATFNQ